MRTFQYLLLATGLLAVSCAAKDPAPAVCGGKGSTPMALTLKDFSPAAGSSVQNMAIAHRFTLVGSLALQGIQSVYPVAHTAGVPMPAFSWTYTPGVAGEVMYQSNAITWTTAPGHVEIDAAGMYQTGDGCVYTLPNPLFAYDVTP